MNHFFRLIGFFHIFCVHCQIIDHFDDNNLNLNPTWSGTLTDFTENTANQLQLNQSKAGTSYLSVPHQRKNLLNTEWIFWLKLNFAPSSSNFERIYLSANHPDLTLHPDGYYLQFGSTGSDDAIELYKQANGVSHLLVSGKKGAIANDFALRLKVYLDSTATWHLQTDYVGGMNFLEEATFQDQSVLQSDYFILQSTYTISNATKFYFDDLYIGPIQQLPLRLLSTEVISPLQVNLFFNQFVDSVQFIQSSYFTSINLIQSIYYDLLIPNKITLLLQDSLPNCVTVSFKVNHYQFKNNQLDTLVNLMYCFASSPVLYDILINEVMADPSPAVNLPEVEYIELVNVSNHPIQLANCMISDGTTNAYFPSRILLPGEYLIIIDQSNLAYFPSALGLFSFPSLNNSGDHIQLFNPNGSVIDSLTYSDTFYQDNVKMDGGYALERKYFSELCSTDLNWSASQSLIGGTPGLVNSIYHQALDSLHLLFYTIVNDTLLRLQFNQSVSISAAQITFGGFKFVIEVSDKFLFLKTASSIQWNCIYSLSLTNLSNCIGSTFSFSLPIIRAKSPAKGDLLMSEILYQPTSDGVDYIEVYNPSDNFIDLEGVYFKTHSINSSYSYTNSSSYFLAPKSYLVFCSDSNKIKTHYPYHGTHFLQLKIPPLSIDSTTLFLFHQGELIDQLFYSDDWQFMFLNDTKGKALEKLNLLLSVCDSTNWKTASETVNFGTPGLPNSHQLIDADWSKRIQLNQSIISPDNDGVDDLIQLHFNIPFEEAFANVYLYHASGIRMDHLFNQLYITKQSTVTWDGFTSNKQQLLPDNYFFIVEVLSLSDAKFIRKLLPFAVTVR